MSDFKKPKRNPRWASISPDGQTILFGRNYNLYWMDTLNYHKALENEEDSTIIDHQITKDGVEYFAYSSSTNQQGNGETNVDKEKSKKKRMPAFVYWSPDSRHFAMEHTDNRAVKDLWVINSIAEPRPTLETYKYWMPGEKEAPVNYILLFDNDTKASKELAVKQFKDQEVNVFTAPQMVNKRDDDWRPIIWLGNNNRFYFERTSRDLKRIDLCAVDITNGNVKPLVEERMNTYVETPQACAGK